MKDSEDDTRKIKPVLGMFSLITNSCKENKTNINETKNKHK